jgi:hypothetical protein
MHYHKASYANHLKNRIPLRLHMTLILLATVLSGLLTTRCLLAAGVENIVIRYPLAVLFSYLMFFCLIKLWLKYLAVTPAQQLRKKKSSFGDTLSNFTDFPSGSGSGGSFTGSGGHFAGAGGQFSGGGASGGFENMSTVITKGSGKTFAESAGSVISEHGGSAIGDAVGGVADGALSGLGDEGGLVGIVVLAVIGAVIAVILGAGIYMIYDAPFILSEAAFEVVLAASLVRSSRTMAEPDWIDGVFRTTWKPFGISLLVAGLGAVVIHANYPQVTRISELVRQVLR